jgi:hypothetical protein
MPAVFPDFNLNTEETCGKGKYIMYFCFRVDRNEVTFKVEPNSLGLNASDVAKKIGKFPVIYFNTNLIVKLRYRFTV